MSDHKAHVDLDSLEDSFWKPGKIYVWGYIGEDGIPVLTKCQSCDYRQSKRMLSSVCRKCGWDVLSDDIVERI